MLRHMELTTVDRGGTVRRMQKSAKEIEGATGPSLDDLLRGMRADGSEAPPLSPAEIAERGGPSQSHLSHVLAGRTGISEKRLYLLAQLLGVTVLECRRAYSVTRQQARTSSC